MTDEAWNSPDVRCLGVRLNGDAIDEIDERGERIVGDTLMILINDGNDLTPFSLPSTGPSERWEMLIDTADPHQPPRRLRGRERYQLQGRSLAVLRLAGHTPRAARDDDWGPMGVFEESSKFERSKSKSKSKVEVNG